MRHDRTVNQRMAASYRRRRAGLVSLALDVPAQALTARLQAYGVLAEGEQPSRAQMAAHCELLLATTLSEVPCAAGFPEHVSNPPARAARTVQHAPAGHNPSRHDKCS